MDPFSSQLANDLENGFTSGVPEHLIQIYKELTAWCELIQCKIDLDMNTHDNIRKQVLSNNLLKYIQSVWQNKVNEFYMPKRNDCRDNLSKICENRINKKCIEETETETEKLAPTNCCVGCDRCNNIIKVRENHIKEEANYNNNTLDFSQNHHCMNDINNVNEINNMNYINDMNGMECVNDVDNVNGVNSINDVNDMDDSYVLNNDNNITTISTNFDECQMDEEIKNYDNINHQVNVSNIKTANNIYFENHQKYEEEEIMKCNDNDNTYFEDPQRHEEETVKYKENTNQCNDQSTIQIYKENIDMQICNDYSNEYLNSYHHYYNEQQQHYENSFTPHSYLECIENGGMSEEEIEKEMLKNQQNQDCINPLISSNIDYSSQSQYQQLEIYSTNNPTNIYKSYSNTTSSDSQYHEEKNATVEVKYVAFSDSDDEGSMDEEIEEEREEVISEIIYYKSSLTEVESDSVNNNSYSSEMESDDLTLNSNSSSSPSFSDIESDSTIHSFWKNDTGDSSDDTNYEENNFNNIKNELMTSLDSDIERKKCFINNDSCIPFDSNCIKYESFNKDTVIECFEEEFFIDEVKEEKQNMNNDERKSKNISKNKKYTEGKNNQIHSFSPIEENVYYSDYETLFEKEDKKINHKIKNNNNNEEENDESIIKGLEEINKKMKIMVINAVDDKESVESVNTNNVVAVDSTINNSHGNTNVDSVMKTNDSKASTVVNNSFTTSIVKEKESKSNYTDASIVTPPESVMYSSKTRSNRINYEKGKLSIIITDNSSSSYSRKKINASNQQEVGNNNSLYDNNKNFEEEKEHLYVRYRYSQQHQHQFQQQQKQNYNNHQNLMCYDEEYILDNECIDSDSIISPNDLLSSSTSPSIYEYTSEKVILTPLYSLPYDSLYDNVEVEDKEEDSFIENDEETTPTTASMNMKLISTFDNNILSNLSMSATTTAINSFDNDKNSSIINQSLNDNNQIVTNECNKSNGNNNDSENIINKYSEESISNYLSTRRDSGFSDSTTTTNEEEEIKEKIKLLNMNNVSTITKSPPLTVNQVQINIINCS